MAMEAQAAWPGAFWHPQASMSSVAGNELVFVRGRGSYLWDSDGRRLLDAPASLWYCNVGHGRAEIADAAAAQMRELEAYSNYGNYATAPTLELAERVAEMAPIEDAKVFFVSGGSDGIDTAAKLARRYWHALGRPESGHRLPREGLPRAARDRHQHRRDRHLHVRLRRAGRRHRARSTR